MDVSPLPSNCRIAKTKTNKMVFSTEDLVLIKVLRQEKGYDDL